MMQTVRLTAASGEVWSTNVNARTKKEAEDYFLYNQYNIGKPFDPTADHVVTVVKVEWWDAPFIPDEERKERTPPIPPKERHVVYNEHTLGVFVGNHIQVLRASIIRGGESVERHLITFYNRKKLRPATPQDFKDYMVELPPEMNQPTKDTP